MRPTVGVVSQAGVDPLTSLKGQPSVRGSARQKSLYRTASFIDAVGPMARTVEDAAYLMDIIADGPKIGRSYSSGLKTPALDGV